jgi:hypothetical protein
MHPQLHTIVEEFQSATARLRRLAEEVPAELWPQRPSADRWSIAECVSHLNLTSAAFLPPLRQMLAEGRSRGDAAPARYRRDILGWLLWRTLAPPVRFRVRTSEAFTPQATTPADDLVGEFLRLQDEQLACVEAADGLPLQKLRIRSPFDRRVSYNGYSALSILPRHQHRHLWQAEQVAEGLRGHA